MTELLTTVDGLLNRKVALEQPLEGYRVALDTVFLAAAVRANAEDQVLELGCGVGGALLCLACRIPKLRGIGLEIQVQLVELYRRNITRNDFASNLLAELGDVAQLPAAFHNRFDHVLMNPPYHEEQRHDSSPNVIKRTANTEKKGDLSLWIKATTSALRSGGSLTLIHRADREIEILELLEHDFGAIEILPLRVKEGGEVRRVIIRARKGSKKQTEYLPDFILHKISGDYTDQTEAILREGKAL